MNIEKRIQRLEQQNNRLKLALIGMGITVVITFIFVLESSTDLAEETEIKIQAHPQGVVEKR